MINVPAAPDAGATMYGHYGLGNPMVMWLLTRRPDLLLLTPTEYRTMIGGNRRGGAPRCGCGHEMRYRFDAEGWPGWKCYRHPDPVIRKIKKPRSAMAALEKLKVSVDELIARAIRGEIVDVLYDPREGGWHIISR